MKALLFFGMIFCHIVDDYYLQGILAQMKQKSWWVKNAPDSMHRNDYLAALLAHGFSWAFMIHVPLFLYYIFYVNSFVAPWVWISLVVNCWLHSSIDNDKANKHILNLIEDQCFHMIQIVGTFGCFLLLS